LAAIVFSGGRQKGWISQSSDTLKREVVDDDEIDLPSVLLVILEHCSCSTGLGRREGAESAAKCEATNIKGK